MHACLNLMAARGQKWDYLGLVWNVLKVGTWEKTPQSLHGKPVVTIWAPEIHYLRKLATESAIP